MFKYSLTAKVDTQAQRTSKGFWFLFNTMKYKVFHTQYNMSLSSSQTSRYTPEKAPQTCLTSVCVCVCGVAGQGALNLHTAGLPPD